MITVPVVQAFFIGILRLVAMGAGVWLYLHSHSDATLLTAAGGLLFFAVTGTAWDVLKVNKQITDAQTTTVATLTQPAGTPAPSQLTAKIEPAPISPEANASAPVSGDTRV
jgi:hypothetical protein